nr:PVC-type heme-binding CxxCH protein [Rubripirellula lacrimiformis]
MLLTAFMATGAFTSTASAADVDVLFLGDSGHHQPRPRFDELAPMMQQRGIQMTYTDDVADLNAETLSKYDTLVLYANIDEVSKDRSDALLAYVNQGGGFVPLHCASYCFRNQPEMVALMGAQFKSHDTGVFQSEVVGGEHPVTAGYGGFQSWDETYVHHLHNDKNRTVLEYRADANGREPWTWVRNQGDGRVFYTAWGHDSRTWTHPGFLNLVERGIRWAAGKDPQTAGQYLASTQVIAPEMTQMAADRADFEYVDVGREIPNYTPSNKWGTQGEPLNMMQKPLSPAESMKHLVVPKGFHVELFASEPDLGGKPIAMAWDERGRLWVAETYDYPNELQPTGKGRDRIRICEDTDGDGKADKFSVFAEQLSIPTGITFTSAGVVVQNGVETLLLTDTDGDDRADQRKVLVANWTLGDTHGGVSNFQYGLDNWIWAMQGYNQSAPVADGEKQQSFRNGFFRMRPDGSQVEFIRSTNNNTWGIGLSEEGLVFGSTANGNPSIYMPIANRYYERVRGWTPSLTLSSIADTNDFQPITDKVRQVDHHGGYTAAAGHALYTAREYPQQYWNRIAFVCGPTGHLVGSFVLNNRGSDFSSTSPFNLLASDDEWTAPIMAEVGPDGQVWVVDWYNYIVQHNPTPEGFQTGKGAAYETKLRDKKYGRIYRLVVDDSNVPAIPNLADATPEQWVAQLANPTQIVRKHAQRLLVQRGNTDVAAALTELIADRSTDAIGLNVGAIHALWTMHGLGLLDGTHPDATATVVSALSHPSAGVRRNALQVLPKSAASIDALLAAGILRDRVALVQLAGLLAISDLPSADQPNGDSVSSQRAAAELVHLLGQRVVMADRWLPDGLTSAAAVHSAAFLGALTQAGELPSDSYQIIQRVAEHHGRGDHASDAAVRLAGLRDADAKVFDAVIAGLAAGLKSDTNVDLDTATEKTLMDMLAKVNPVSRGTLVKLATAWGSKNFTKYQQQIVDDLLDQVTDEDGTDDSRIDAAKQAIAFLPDDEDLSLTLLEEVNPRTPPAVAAGIMTALGESRWDGIGAAIAESIPQMTPTLKQIALLQLLRRPSSTMAMLEACEAGELSLSDLALDQKQSLANHPNARVKKLANRLLAQGGSLPNADRQRVVQQYLDSTKLKGDVAKGTIVFKEHCSKCHVHGDVGTQVGPNLTGMAVHPKAELLTHILDPSRSVEGNFRSYTVLTLDGVVLNGMLASESKTSIELFDTEGKKRSVLREDIDQFVMSTKSVMPEGFENAIKLDAMTDLLEFLTQKSQFVPISLDKYATAISTKSLFTGNPADVMVFDDWQPKTFAGVPFVLTDPMGQSKANIISLYGPRGPVSKTMPRSVTLPCNTPVAAIHLLGGVGGWNSPFGTKGSESMIVRLKFGNGTSEDHPLLNGVHMADYIRRVDVPDSEFAFALRNHQVRYLKVTPQSHETVETIELLKGTDDTAPLVMAVTIETLSAGH